MDRIVYAWETVTPPVFEPLSLEEARAQCRLDGSTDYDHDLTWLIQVAREKVENDSERVLIAQTRRVWFDQFPNAGHRATRTLAPFPSQPWLYGGAMQALEIVLKPVTGVTSITYLDQGGTWQTWDPSNYLVDCISAPCRITPAYGLIWPICRVQIHAVQVVFTAGANRASLVPAMARHAMRLLIGHWFENREAVGDVPGEIAQGYESLINGIRWH
jgi:hypothetical protein